MLDKFTKAQELPSTLPMPMPERGGELEPPREQLEKPRRSLSEELDDDIPF